MEDKKIKPEEYTHTEGKPYGYNITIHENIISCSIQIQKSVSFCIRN